jgi:hypothetical protein
VIAHKAAAKAALCCFPYPGMPETQLAEWFHCSSIATSDTCW